MKIKKYCHSELVLKRKKTSFINEVDKIAKKLGHRSAGITLANKIYELANKTISPYPYNEYSQLSVLPEYETVRNMEGGVSIDI